MSFLFVNRDYSFGFFSDTCNDGTFNFFTCGIIDKKIISEINENRAEEPTSVTPDKSVTFTSDFITKVDEELSIPTIGNYNDIIVSQFLNRRFRFLSPDSDIGIQFLELF